MEAVVLLSIIPGRAEPSDRAELTTQFLFGERLEILEHNAEWSLVKNHTDGYVCWVNNLQITKMTLFEANRWDEVGISYNFKLYRPIITSKGNMILPVGAHVPNTDKVQIGSQRYIFGENHGKIPNWDYFLKSWLNAPYLWGGRTHFGIDCSAFAQHVMAYKDIALPRDAWMQAQNGIKISELQNSREGDLAFFEKNEKITHVGVVLEDQKIIHASGHVRIDQLTPEGIYNMEKDEITHQLCAIQRIT